MGEIRSLLPMWNLMQGRTFFPVPFSNWVNINSLEFHAEDEDIKLSLTNRSLPSNPPNTSHRQHEVIKALRRRGWWWGEISCDLCQLPVEKGKTMNQHYQLIISWMIHGSRSMVGEGWDPWIWVEWGTLLTLVGASFELGSWRFHFGWLTNSHQLY